MALAKLGATDGGVVQGWLEEEHAYLKGLSKEPLEETLEMEYYKMALSLWDSECVFFFSVRHAWLPLFQAKAHCRQCTLVKSNTSYCWPT